MSQDLAIQQTQLLQQLKQSIGSAFQALGPKSALSEGIGASYGILHYRGRQWSLTYRGQTNLFTRPDDGSPASYIDVVILDSAANKSKSFYEAFDVDNMSKRPKCSSIDGVKPDADAVEPQSTACAICPRDAWTTDQTGRKSKACSDYKRVAVLLMPSVSARLFNGKPLIEPVFLRVPAASLADLAAYGELLEGMGIHPASLVTRISFDPQQPSYPKMMFRALQALTDAEGPVVLPLVTSDITKRIIGGGTPRPVQQIAPPAPIATGLVPPPAQAPQPIHVSPPQQQQQPIHVSPPPQQQAPVIDVTPTLIEGPADFAATAQAVFAQQAPVTATVTPQITATNPADVGAPIESDAVLDGRLSSLFPNL